MAKKITDVFGNVLTIATSDSTKVGLDVNSTMVYLDREEAQEAINIVADWIKKTIPKRILKHEDLHEAYVEGDEIFDGDDFEFVGTDGKMYRFDVVHFDYLCDEYRREDYEGLITLNNGSIEQMIEHKIAILIE